jgi:hypothetical protein
VRKDRSGAVEKWRDALIADGYAVSTVHTYIAGIACGLGIDMTGLAHSGTSEDKRKAWGVQIAPEPLWKKKLMRMLFVFNAW